MYMLLIISHFIFFFALNVTSKHLTLIFEVKPVLMLKTVNRNINLARVLYKDRIPAEGFIFIKKFK